MQNLSLIRRIVNEDPTSGFSVGQTNPLQESVSIANARSELSMSTPISESARRSVGGLIHKINAANPRIGLCTTTLAQLSDHFERIELLNEQHVAQLLDETVGWPLFSHVATLLMPTVTVDTALVIWRRLSFAQWAKSPCWRQLGKRVSITRGALAEYLIQLPTPAFGAVHDGKTGSP